MASTTFSSVFADNNDSKAQGRLHSGDIIAIVTGIIAIFIGFITLILHMKHKKKASHNTTAEMGAASPGTSGFESVLQSRNMTVNNYNNCNVLNAHYPIPFRATSAEILSDSDYPIQPPPAARLQINDRDVRSGIPTMQFVQ